MKGIVLAIALASIARPGGGQSFSGGGGGGGGGGGSWGGGGGSSFSYSGGSNTTYSGGSGNNDLQFAKVQIELEIESNYCEIDTSGKEHRYWALDRMTLARAQTAKSRPPKRARTLDCPNCGAPLSAIRGSECSYCNKDVGAGRFDWHVEAFRNVTKESRGPLLTSTVEEVGTDFPTIVAPGAENRLDAIAKRDPAFGWNASEYWTLVRGTTHGAKKGDDLSCPSCGAPLKISMVGNCDHCRVKVTSGEFDWVLSRIEQDEVYTG